MKTIGQCFEEDKKHFLIDSYQQTCNKIEDSVEVQINFVASMKENMDKKRHETSTK